jgi:hypothetical protein
MTMGRRQSRHILRSQLLCNMRRKIIILYLIIILVFKKKLKKKHLQEVADHDHGQEAKLAYFEAVEPDFEEDDDTDDH